MVPCVVFEDADLLVVNKPAGWNTHAPSHHAGEGLYEWLRNREPRWADLSILHRLDKETSGLIVFGKTAVANRSLTAQFTERRIEKHYLLITDRPVPHDSWTVQNHLVRRGQRYVETADQATGEPAETHFQVLKRSDSRVTLSAKPVTGRTHQIRVHAAQSGVPILGDELYGGTQFQRVCLHAESIRFAHPGTNREVSFHVPAQFELDSRQSFRAALIDSESTSACRLIHGAADGWPGWYVDRLGAFLLSQSETGLDVRRTQELNRLTEFVGAEGIYHKQLTRRIQKTTPEAVCPQLVCGRAAPDRFVVKENGMQFELSFQEGYSTGLFLDQRDNRRRLLTGYIAPGFEPGQSRTSTRPVEVLNIFAYTCSFSVCAAKAGARVTSLDLSRKYLDWGRRNFELNDLNPSEHDFIYGDALDWMKRLHKKGRRFDLIILDPPTFSQSKQGGVFRVERDFAKLVDATAGLFNPYGCLLASSNSARWSPASFLETVHSALRTKGRRTLKEHYQPQPPDFPVSRSEPAYLKTAWFVLQ